MRWGSGPVSYGASIEVLTQEMLIKLIQCRVSEDQRERFSRGQTQWCALSGCKGFCGQIGGWVVEDDGLAVIIGLWSDHDAYDTFMRDVHDRVLDVTGQRGTYDSIDVSLWDSVLSIPGSASSISAGIESAGAVRMAKCRVRPDRVAHFVEVQRTLWNPGMAASGGMLIGLFSESSGSEQEFLVCTLWQDLDAHRRYRNGVFTDLRRQAEVDQDCERVEGWIVSVQHEWCVGAASSLP